MQVLEVNAKGYAEIREILAKRAKAWAGYAPEAIPNEAIYEYAAEVEDSAAGGNSAGFEIRGLHSVSGNPETFTLSDDAVDAVEYDD